MYGYIIFLHVAGVFLFLLAHGASASVSFQLKRERNADRIRALLDVSIWSFGAMFIGLLLLLITGIVAGFMSNAWGRGWIWASIVLLVAIFAVMSVLGS